MKAIMISALIVVVSCVNCSSLPPSQAPITAVEPAPSAVHKNSRREREYQELRRAIERAQKALERYDLEVPRDPGPL